MPADSEASAMMNPAGLPGAGVSAGTTARWYTNPAILMPGGLLLVYVLIYILPLGYRPLVIPNEVRYAEIPREMLATGDWVTPQLNGLRYFEKPPLGYWLNALSIAALGENDFAVRFPSALAAGMTSLIVFLFTLSVWKNRRIALAAALVQLTFLETYVVGTFSVLDNFVTLFLTAGIYTFYLAASTPQKTAASWRLWALSGSAFGLAFLVKGFLAFAVPAIVLLPWMIWQGQWRMLLEKSWLPILAAILVALPWAIMIHLREGDFWHYFFWIEHIQRFASEDAQHQAPAYYFLMYLPLLAFPWICLLPATISGLREAGRVGLEKRGALRLLWLWLLLPFLFFSVSNGKLLTYILPCFPPFAVLTAVGLAAYLNSGRSKLFNYGMLLNALLLVSLFAVLLTSQALDVGFRAYGEDEYGKLILATLALLLGASAALAAVLTKRIAVKLASSLAAIMLLLFVLSFVVPDETLWRKSPELPIMQFRDQINENTILISDASMVHALAWYLKRDDIYMIRWGELEYGLGYPDARHRILNPEQFMGVLGKYTPTHSILVVCREKCPERFTTLLPPAFKNTTWGSFTFWFAPVTGASHPKTGAPS
jgi:4-amino-4-deoxy-L-arabinose transferase